MFYRRKGLNITSFIIGSVLGASAVFALSPKSRKQFSRDVKLKSEKYLSKVKKSTNDLVQNSRASAQSLQRKAEEIMNTVQQYAMGKLNKPVSFVESEITGLKAAITAAKTSYSLNPEIRESEVEVNSFLNEFEDETLPKQLGMGKGRDRKSYTL